jgi:hypothetical protein
MLKLFVMMVSDSDEKDDLGKGLEGELKSRGKRTMDGKA